MKSKKKNKKGKKKSSDKAIRKASDKAIQKAVRKAVEEAVPMAVQEGVQRAFEESLLFGSPGLPTPYPGEGNYGSNYAVFEWDGSVWEIKEDCCNYGCVPQPPETPGTFPSERTKTACQAMVEGMPCPPAE